MNISIKEKKFLGFDLVALLRLVRPFVVIITALIIPTCATAVVFATWFGSADTGLATAQNIGTLFDKIPTALYGTVVALAGAYTVAKTTEAFNGVSKQHEPNALSDIELNRDSPSPENAFAAVDSPVDISDNVADPDAGWNEISVKYNDAEKDDHIFESLPAIAEPKAEQIETIEVDLEEDIEDEKE